MGWVVEWFFLNTKMASRLAVGAQRFVGKLAVVTG